MKNLIDKDAEVYYEKNNKHKPNVQLIGNYISQQKNKETPMNVIGISDDGMHGYCSNCANITGVNNATEVRRDMIYCYKCARPLKWEKKRG